MRQLVGPRRAKIESTQGVPVARSSAKSETHLNPHRMAVSDAAGVMARHAHFHRRLIRLQAVNPCFQRQL